jgi:hypothetical protein
VSIEPLSQDRIDELWALVDKQADRAQYAWRAAEALKAELSRARNAEETLRGFWRGVTSEVEHARREGIE